MWIILVIISEIFTLKSASVNEDDDDQNIGGHKKNCENSRKNGKSGKGKGKTIGNGNGKRKTTGNTRVTIVRKNSNSNSKSSSKGHRQSMSLSPNRGQRIAKSKLKKQENLITFKKNQRKSMQLKFQNIENDENNANISNSNYPGAKWF